MNEHARKYAAEMSAAPLEQVSPRLILVGGDHAPKAPATRPSASAAEQLLSVELPSRPGVLAELGAEMQKSEPDFDRVSELVNVDVGLSAALIKTANSPSVGLGRQVTSVQQAIYYLGLGEVFAIVTGLLLRRAFPSSDPNVERVWEASAKRAALMGRFARELGGLPRDRAHTCGLFENCGMAVLLIYAAGYSRGFEQIEAAPNSQELERAQFGLDHAVIGEAMVRTWGLSQEIAAAVRYHHDLLQLDVLDLVPQSRKLIAVSSVVTEALARSAGHRRAEWEVESNAAAAVLGLTPADLEAGVCGLP